jgi:hypothetical protein
MFSPRVLGILFTALVGIASRSEASIITVPIGLAPGSQYRLVFITNGTYTAASASISTYNNDITNEVAAIPQLAALGATWTAIGSTESVSAATNIGFSASTVGIYLLDGTTKVANGTGTTGSGLFSGSILNPLNLDDLGITLSSPVVWTGSNTDGTIDSTHALGEALPEAGNPQFSNQWLQASNGALGTVSFPLYGISSTLTVPGTPEPGTTILVALGSGLLLLVQRARKMRPSHYSQTDR